MLLLEDSQLLFNFLQLLSTARICPFSVDKESGKLGKLNRREYLTWAALYALVVIPLIHGLWQFVQLLLFRRENVVLIHLPVQFSALITSLLFHIALPTLFHHNRSLIIQVFNEL